MSELSNENNSSESEETEKMKEEQLRPETEVIASGEPKQIIDEMTETMIAEPETAEQSVEESPETEQGESIKNETIAEVTAHSAGSKPEAAEDIPEEVHEDQEDDRQDDDSWFEGMTRENLLEFVVNAIEHSDERNMNKKVMQARSAFNKLAKEALEDAREKWKSEGKDENDFEWEDGNIRDDFNKAFKAYKKSREGYIVGLNIEKEKNLVAKKELLESLKAFVENEENLSNISQFKKLQEDWRKTGHVPIADAENIWNSYNFYVNKFYEQRSLYSEFKDLDNKRNFTAKEDIISKIEALHAMEDIEEAFRLLRGYQDDWKHVGPVPKEKRDDINLRFRNAVIPIYEKKEKISEERQKISEQNFRAKMDLMTKIEEIADYQTDRAEDWVNKNTELSQWIENWRSIGPIPFKKNDELKERLSAAIRKFNKNKNEFFKLRKHEKSQNLARKTELCEKAEEYAKSENPASHRKDVILLQEEWKKFGAVPYQYTDKLKNRFRAACNSVFDKIADSHKDMVKGQIENLKLKTEIVEKIEELIKAEKIEAAEDQVNQFQDDFAAIGHVPYSEKDKIRKRFYAALNKLIAKAGLKSEEDHKSNPLLSYRLTIQKWSKDNGGNERIETEERKNTRELKRIEGEIATLENNIEFFRNSKNADDLRAKMNKEIADLKTKMTDIQEKIKVIRATARR